MTDTPDAGERARVGLCAGCAHARRLVSAKQSVFYRCGLARDDPGFPTWPPLPVVRCRGHRPGTPRASDERG